jgi:hypothetical protein
LLQVRDLPFARQSRPQVTSYFTVVVTPKQAVTTAKYDVLSRKNESDMEWYESN